MALLRNIRHTPGAPSGRVADTAAANTASTSVGVPRFTLKPSKQTCMILGGAMGVVVIGCMGLYFWQTAQLADVQKQVDEKRNEVASGQKIASKLVQVTADYSDTQGKLKFLETSVSENHYVPTLLHQTEALAKSTNLQVNSLRPSLEPAPKVDPKDPNASKTPPQPYDKIHIDMDIRGTYWNVAQMLYKLTEFPKIMAVESVQLSPQGQPGNLGGSPNLGVHLRLTGFIFPNDGTATPAAPIAGTDVTAPAAATPGVGVPQQQAPTTTPTTPARPSQPAPQQRAMTTLPAPVKTGI